MLGLDDLEVEGRVLDFVAAEVLGRQHARHAEEQRGQRRRKATKHGDLS
jgi:hypothetical protein